VMEEYINEKLKRLLDEFEEEERRREKAEAKKAGSRIAHSVRITQTTVRYRTNRKKWK